MLPKGTWGGKAFSEWGFFLINAKAIHERDYESHMQSWNGREKAAGGTRIIFSVEICSLSMSFMLPHCDGEECFPPDMSIYPVLDLSLLLL